MHLLFATDGSPGALAAADLLAQLPLPPASRITLLAVTGAEDDSERILSATRSRLGEGKAQLETMIRTGSAAVEILAAAQEQKPDLLVLGSRGLSPVSRFLLGSVAERVARHTGCAVLVARPLRHGLKTILLATDGSDCAAVAADLLGRLPLPGQAAVQVVRVLPFREDLVRCHKIQTPFSSQAEAELYADREVRNAQSQVDAVAAALAGEGRPAAGELRSGDPAEALLEAVEAGKADLLVVGSQGLGALERFFMGSVSEKVLRHAPCSVLVAR